MGDASLQVDLVPELDKETLKDILQTVRSTFGNEKIKLNFKEGAGEKKETGIVGNMLGGVVEMFTKVIGPLAILASVAEVLKPAFSIVKQIFRVVSETLRPIADILIIALQPLLVILRPILTTVRTLMQPFKSIAMQMSGMASQLISKGNVTEGTVVAQEAIKTMVGPFITIIVAESLKLASVAITQNIGSVLNSFIDILKALDITGMMGERLDQAKIAINAGLNDANTAVQDGITFIETNLLSSMQKGAQDKLTEFKTTYSGLLKTNVTDVLDTSTLAMQQSMSTYFGKSDNTIPSTFSSGLDAMDKSTSNFMSKLQSYADKINSINFGGGGVKVLKGGYNPNLGYMGIGSIDEAAATGNVNG